MAVEFGRLLPDLRRLRSEDLGSNVTTDLDHVSRRRPVPKPLPPDSAVATVGDLTVTLAGSLGIRCQLDPDVRHHPRRAAGAVRSSPTLPRTDTWWRCAAGDLGYLHMHPMGEPGDGTTRPGPEVKFMAAAPTDGTTCCTWTSSSMDWSVPLSSRSPRRWGRNED